MWCGRRTEIAFSSIVVTVFSLFVFQHIGAQTTGMSASTDSISLVEGVPSRSSRPLPSNEFATYEFEATEGETYLVRVEQQGLDLRIAVASPAGVRTSFTSPTFRDEAEFFLLQNASAGTYEITIGSEEFTGAQATPSLLVSALDVASTDPREIKAWLLMSDGAVATAEGFRVRPEDAIDAYAGAAERWKALGETRREAQALYSLAILHYWGVYEYADAARYASVAAKLYGALNEPTLQANALFVQAYSIIEVPSDATDEDAQRSYETGLELFERSYDIHQRLGNTYDLAHVANNIALTYYYRGKRSKGDPKQAEKFWREALALFDPLGETRHSLGVRQNLALNDIEEGYAANAVATLEQLIAELDANNAEQLRSAMLGNLGAAYRRAGQYDKSLEIFSASLDISERTGDLWRQSYALRGLSATYTSLGELDRSVGYLEQARALAIDAGYARVEAAAVASLGNVAYWRSDFQAALDYHQEAVGMSQSASDRAFHEALVVRDLVALRRFDDAISTATDLLSRGELLEVTQADILQEIGWSYLGADNNQEADASFRAALDIYRSLGLRAEQADVFNGLSLAARAGGDLPAALDYGNQSLMRFEELRVRVDAPELRAVFSSTGRDYYETQIDLLMSSYKGSEGGRIDLLHDALSISERSRARVTRELLAEASIDLGRDLPPGVVDRRRALQETLAAFINQRDYLLLERVDAGEEVLKQRTLDEVNASLVDVENDLTLLEIQIRKDHPKYSRYSSVDPLTGEEIRSAIDPGSVLLQYSLGAERSFVWVVTDKSLQVVELAGRDSIESAARAAFESLKTYRLGASAKRRQDEELSELSSLILAPVAHLFDRGRSRVLIAAEGALQYIPFGALPLKRNGKAVPFVETAEIIGVPSISVLAALREREYPTPADKLLAVFADPVFSELDPRLAELPNLRVTAAQSGPESIFARSSVARRLQRLPSSGAEGRAIVELLPEDSRVLVTGLAATRDAVVGMNLSEYRYIHFATHGLIDSHYPALSALALSNFDERGATLNGFLRLNDVYGLDLNADLVVLSACETALGREIRGEGLLGLTQGFLYAGAKALVVSLWPVPDGPTAALMTRFYRYMLEKDLRPAAALSRAQVSLARERSDPYFWAGFIVLGDG